MHVFGNDNDNDVYFTLATSDGRIGKYKTEWEMTVQGRPRSLILVLIDSAYATSC